MVADKQPDQRSYQWALRVVGRYLDSEPTNNVSITETNDGFTVRAYSTSIQADERVKHFQWDRLEDLDQYYRYANRGMGGKPPKVAAPHFPCGHQAALRKLGALLDEEHASGLSVDEVENGLDVSYSHPREDDAQGVEKRQHVYTADDLCS